MVAMGHGCYGLWLLWLPNRVHAMGYGCYGLPCYEFMVDMVYSCYGYLTEYMLWLWLLWLPNKSTCYGYGCYGYLTEYMLW